MTALLAEYLLRKHPGERIVYDVRASWAVPDRVRAVLLRDTTGGASRQDRFGDVPVVYGTDGDAIAATLPPTS